MAVPGTLPNMGAPKPQPSGTTGSSSVASATLGLGLELLMLGIAGGLANMSEDVGKILVVFMIGLLILFLMYHTLFVQTIPNMFNMIQQGKI